jgi:hypothetical protein
MSNDENGKGSERGTPKASSAVKEHARKMLAKLRAKLSAAQMRFVAHSRVWRAYGMVRSRPNRAGVDSRAKARRHSARRSQGLPNRTSLVALCSYSHSISWP